MPLENGIILANRYRIERILGQGGMGAVYLATDENLGTHVAVKENLNVSPESERQFKREATLLATLRHNHLPRVTNHFVTEGQQYLVMDFVEGEDLKERLNREGRQSEAEVKRWGEQICDALGYLHTRTPPVIHRDIKPGNIKLTSYGDAMLVDFGIAKASSSESKTTTSAAAFTPGYAPPEQYGMGRSDPRTDQYALAATLYTLLTGQTPPDSMERLLGNAQLTPPEQLIAGLNSNFAAAIRRALELRPENRFETITQFREAMLGRAPMSSEPTRIVPVSEATIAAPPKVEAPFTPPPAARPGWLIPAAIGAVALFILGGSALAFTLMNNGTLGTPTQPATGVVSIATEPVATEVPASPTPAPTVAPTETAAPPTPTEAPTATLEPSPTVPANLPQVGGGGRIAFISNRDGQTYQIYTMNPDGSDVQQVTADPLNKWSPSWELGRLGPLPGTHLAWSPDGSQLIYTAEVSPGGPTDLWLVNVDGTNPVNLTAPDRAGRTNENDYHPTWCNDGANDVILFTSIRNNSPQIFVFTLADRTARNYSTSRSNPLEFNPMVFSDCRRMLILSTQNGRPELWRIFPSNNAKALMWLTFPEFPGANRENSYRVFLSEIAQGNNILDAALSPDNFYVAYTRDASAGRTIWLATVEDSQLLMKFQVLADSRSDTNPQWSPDGRYLVFVSKRDGGNQQIFRMTAAGNEETNLSLNAFTELSPVWQPTP